MKKIIAFFIVISTIMSVSAQKIGVVITPDGSLTFCLHDSVTLEASSGFVTYSWNTGDSTQSITVGDSGTYSVTVTDGVSNTFSNDIDVNVLFPPMAEICMATIDTAINKALVIWEKEVNSAIEAYNIYRSSGAGYQLAGTLPFDSLSVFVDTSSHPGDTWYRYALTVIDTCGNESALSAFHQTMHLQAEEGTNANTIRLNWSEYIDSAAVFNFSRYFIFSTDDLTSFNVLDSVNAGVTTLDNIDTMLSKQYFVSVFRPTFCYPQRKICNYTIELHDLGNDGWNGAEVAVNVGGQEVGVYTLASGGGPETHQFLVENGNSIVFDYSEGTNPSENYYYVYNSEMEKVFTDSAGVVIKKPVGGVRVAACPGSKASSGPYSQSLSNLEDNGIVETEIETRIKEQQIVVFPNPAADVLYIMFDAAENQDYTMNIYDISGKMVKTYTSVSSGKLIISTADLTKGFYSLEVQGENIFRARFVKE